MRKKDSRQPSLFDIEVFAPAPSKPVMPRGYLDELKEQVIRDKQTLRMEPEFWAPSREFYEQRIAAYLEEINQG